MSSACTQQLPRPPAGDCMLLSLTLPPPCLDPPPCAGGRWHSRCCLHRAEPHQECRRMRANSLEAGASNADNGLACPTSDTSASCGGHTMPTLMHSPTLKNMLIVRASSAAGREAGTGRSCGQHGPPARSQPPHARQRAAPPSALTQRQRAAQHQVDAEAALDAQAADEADEHADQGEDADNQQAPAMERAWQAALTTALGRAHGRQHLRQDLRAQPTPCRAHSGSAVLGGFSRMKA